MEAGGKAGRQRPVEHRRMFGVLPGHQEHHRLAGQVTCLPSPGMRTTAFGAHDILRRLALHRAVWPRNHGPVPGSREIASEKVAKYFRMSIHSTDGDDPRIWPVPPRRGRRNSVPRHRTDRAGPTRGGVASTAPGAGGAPVSKDALIEAAWPGLAVEDSNLTVQIAALRRVFRRSRRRGLDRDFAAPRLPLCRAGGRSG